MPPHLNTSRGRGLYRTGRRRRPWCYPTRSRMTHENRLRQMPLRRFLQGPGVTLDLSNPAVVLELDEPLTTESADVPGVQVKTGNAFVA